VPPPRSLNRSRIPRPFLVAPGLSLGAGLDGSPRSRHIDAVITRFSAVLALAVALFLVVASGSSSHTAAFPGKNGKIVVPVGMNLGGASERPPDFYTVTPRGTQLRRILRWRPRREGPSSVQWSPNGREIVFIDQCGITIATATGTHRRCLGVDGFDPSWSPDGSRLVFERNTPDVYTLQIVTRDGRLLTTIPITVGFPRDLAWSPLGDRIAFEASEINQGASIYLIRPDGTGLSQLTTGPRETGRQPNWSPNGKRILFIRNSYQVWVMDADGSHQRKLLVVPRSRAAPDEGAASAVWSPDGTKIAYASPGARSISIYTLRTRTRKTIPLRLPRGFVVSWNERLDWQPIRR
jgi:Tol biopolymer transport system component